MCRFNSKGCVVDASGFGWCEPCRMALRKKCIGQLNNEQKGYDVEMESRRGNDVHDEYFRKEKPTSCSCHINPPCSFCCDDSDQSDDS